MHIIKLNAIDSTNSYLKELVVDELVQNFTAVVAEHQISGRGQMGTVWESEKGKNLTFSVLIEFDSLRITDQFYLSMAVALGVLTGVKGYVNSNLYVKWPNDILADKDKLAGILIENILKGANVKYAIVGIGVNVNQELFSNEIKNVTSLKKNSGHSIDKDALLEKIVASIKYFVGFVEKKQFQELKELYIDVLFKFNKPAMFIDNSGNQFLGKIIDISEDGRLEIELENEKTRKFNLKEIKFASR